MAEVRHLQLQRLERTHRRRHDLAREVGELELAERLRILDQHARVEVGTGSLLTSSYTTIFREPTIVARRSLLGASHESSTCAIAPCSYSRLMRANSGMFGKMQLRLVAATWDGVTSSQ